MKLESLYINGYGILNDFHLNFEEDLTVIYGLNGTGKSTLLSFFRACLYGFYPRNSNRRYEPLQGGTHGGHLKIQHDGVEYLIERRPDRRSAGQVTIENLSTGKVEPQSKLEVLLSGISQSVFENVFAFGLKELQELELLDDQELSSHLYSVGLGSRVSLAKINQQLTEAMEEIYKPRGRKPKLNALLTEVLDIRQQLLASKKDIQAHQQLTNEVNSVSQLIKEQRDKIKEIRSKLQRTNLLLEIWPQWQEFLIIENKLAKYPEFQLPTQTFERAKNARQQIELLTMEVNQLLEKIPGVDLNIVQTVNCQALQSKLAEYKQESSAQQVNLDVAKERFDKSKTEIDYLENKLTVIKQEIRKINGGHEQAELAIRQQWLSRLQQLEREKQEMRPNRSSLLSLFGSWGWLLIAILFLITKTSIAVIFSGIGFLASLIHYFYQRQMYQSKKQALVKEWQDLAVKLGLSEPDLDCERLAQEMELEAELEQERLAIERELEIKKIENIKLQTDFQESQANVYELANQWQEILKLFSLPISWSWRQVEEFIQVAERIPALTDRIKQYQIEFQRIAQDCGTSDFHEIEALYEQQGEREKLLQQFSNLEVLLTTYLNEDLVVIKQKLRRLSKEELVARKNQLEEELQKHESDLETGLNRLGSLTTKRELLENNQEQEHLKLELEIADAKIQELTVNWMTDRFCLWAIEQVKQRYEKEKQPELLLYTSEYFNQITQGKYLRVFAPLDTQMLKIEDYKGRILEVPQLSQGTVEQLYLALRFALIVCMKEQGVQLPIVVDDILVNFDHLRLAQTIDLLHLISQNQQIIMLTCHRFLLDYFTERQIRYIND